LRREAAARGFAPKGEKTAAKASPFRKSSLKFLDLQPKRFMIYLGQKYEAINLDGFVKSPHSGGPRIGSGAGAGVQIMDHHSKSLDSGFRRNNGKTNFQARRRGA
jgi:hypothetical protein